MIYMRHINEIRLFMMSNFYLMYEKLRIGIMNLHRSRLNTSFLLLTLVALLMLCSAGDVRKKSELYLPDYNTYHNLTRIRTHLMELWKNYPEFIHLDSEARSKEGRPQFLLRITNTSNNFYSSPGCIDCPAPKVRVLLSFGEHAREFLPIETLFFLISNITEGLNSPVNSYAHSYSRLLLNKVDLYMVAMVNPDGRHLVERTHNYCWRGTSSGVDLNRNFDWQFGNKGSSDDNKDEEYRGESVFSEPECMVLVELTKRLHFDAFISFHSGIKHIYIPYADSVSKVTHRRPENAEAMLDLADKMSASVSNRFSFGIAYELSDYTADGTIFDYMAGVRHIPFSYAIELWGRGDYPGARCFDLFNPRSVDLSAALRENHPLFSTFLTYIINWKQAEHYRQSQKFDNTQDIPTLTFGFALLFIVIIITIFVAASSYLPLKWGIFPRRRVVSLRALSSTFTMVRLRAS